MPLQNDFPEVFQHLKAILTPYSPKLHLQADTTSNYYLDGGYAEQFKRDMFFGSVSIRKNYVSFYLMGVYAFPALLNDVSPELRKHMQGKSCFNFKKVDQGLFDELSQLTKRCFEYYERKGWLAG